MGVSSATIRLDLEHNRPFIDLEFEAADGSVHMARTWVDSGGGGFQVTKSLADRIGLQAVGVPFVTEGTSVHARRPALPRIVLALRGHDGERRTLVVLRDGVQIEVQAEIRRII